jgi:predicted small secreted protein
MPHVFECDGGNMRSSIHMMCLASILLLGACNTVKGAGKDIQSVGQAGQDAINTTKKKK